MNNKILVLVYVPILNQEYDCFIPIGKTVGTIKKVLLDTIGNFNEIEFLNQVKIYDREKNLLYSDDMIIKNTNIRNGSKLLLI